MKLLRNLTALLLSLSLGLVALAKLGTEYQMQLGNPTGAKTDDTNHSHYLIKRTQYVLDYNDLLGTPNWVSWDLTADDMGSAERSKKFFLDTSLPTGFTIVSLDYQYSTYGYARGHMCPSADRTTTRADNDALFFMTNMIPQIPANNSGLWETFESYCRTLATGTTDNPAKELLIISGPMGYSTHKVIGFYASVPDEVWKIVIVVPTGPGTALERLTADCRVIALRTPNDASASSKKWTDCITTIDALEKQLGYTFLSSVPKEIADVLRFKLDGGSTGSGTGTSTTPVITSQPASTQTVALGANANFSVVATTSSGTLSFQWLKDDMEILGATGQTYSIASVTNADAGSYTVRVTNDVGTTSSNIATLKVTTQVLNDASIIFDFNTNASASVFPASGLTVSAFTQNNNNGTTALITNISPTITTAGKIQYTGASGTNNIGAATRANTDKTLNTSSGTSGSTYFEVNLQASTSNYVTLSYLYFGSRSTGTGPTKIEVYASTNGFTAANSFATYVLQQNVPADSTWYYYKPSISPIGIPPGKTLTLRIYGYAGGGNVASNTAIWRMDDIQMGLSFDALTPSITTQPSDLLASVGGVATFSVGATSPGTLSYQWRKNGTPIIGNVSATTASLALSGLSASDIASYDCVVTSSYPGSPVITASQTTTAAQLSVTQSYDAWAASAGLSAANNAQSADADGDGVPNLVEYALGLNPLVPDSQLLPACELSAGQASLRFTRPKTSEGFAYNVETSTDLATWQQLGAATESSTATTETLVAQVPSDATRRFFRLALGSVRTVPVGYTRLALPAASTTAFAPVLDDVQSPLAGIRSGFVDTFTTSSITNTSGAWTGNLADPAAPWALRFTSGVAAGRQFDVKSNTSTSITLVGIDLSSLGLVAGVDRFELIPLETLGTLLGSTTLTGGTSSATADIVQVRSGAVWLAFYYNTQINHWTRTIGTAANADNTIVRPGSALTIQRRGTALNLSFTGRVLASPFRVLVAKAGATVISQGYPTDTTLAALSLQTLLPGWRTGTADQLYLHNGTTWIGYYHNGSAWVRTSDLSSADQLAIPGTAALTIQRSGTTAGSVELVRSLSF